MPNKIITLDNLAEFRDKILHPGLVGYGSTVSGIDNNFNGLVVNVPSDVLTTLNGFYVFTYGNCFVTFPLYNIQANVEYKVAAALVDANGNYVTKILTIRIVPGSLNHSIQIYSKENIIPVGYTAYLFKIKLY